jgi:drug/metabolite transporter (DMT)-like permease
MDGTGKYLTSSLSVGHILWARYFFHILIVFLVLSRSGSFEFLRTKKPGLQFVRAAAVFGATICMYSALRVIPLADATAIQFLNPAFVTLFAAWLLKEKIGWHRITAVAVGFGAVLLIIRPGFAGFDWHFLLPLVTAVLVALYIVLTRRLSEFDDEMTTFFYSMVLGAVVLTLALPWLYTAPSPRDWMVSIAMGVLGAGGHLLLVKALHRVQASFLSPYMYAQLIVAVLISVFWFGDIPDLWVVIGIIIVVLSGLYVWRREQFLHRTGHGSAQG